MLVVVRDERFGHRRALVLVHIDVVAQLVVASLQLELVSQTLSQLFLSGAQHLVQVSDLGVVARTDHGVAKARAHSVLEARRTPTFQNDTVRLLLFVYVK